MEGTSSLRMIEELQEASMDMAIAEAPMIGLQTTEENIESSICNAMEDEEAENEETICQTSSDTGVINMSSSYVIVGLTERPAANATADAVQNDQSICQGSAEPGPVTDTSDIVVKPMEIHLPYSISRIILTIQKLTKDSRTLVVQKIPDSYEISSEFFGHKFNEDDVFNLQENTKFYVMSVRESKTEECFIFTIRETGQVVNVKIRTLNHGLL
ncbi:uncharacterized protein LOC124314246 isoform X2 [Daphnia pulicaria]|uniref:uncharacterized protein LOC124314246 isoform X2 n=1 Tax=Daphnia pulicaria TaxID=35523 RepID=UPI001EEA1385|nr:uncharacterized protein LOC124314246 isoform X2 [Daphnia pulicaria]